MLLRSALIACVLFTFSRTQARQLESNDWQVDIANGFPSMHDLPAGKKGIMTLSRLAPAASELYIANSDGTNMRKLLGNQTVAYDYHASFSHDGKYITFTSERNGGGQADLYRVLADGSGLEKLVATPSVEDQGVLSPDNTKLAYVSSANGWKANIWIKDLATGKTWNLTNTATVKGVPWSPDGYFKPAWSPDGQWIAFTSDRNTEYFGHADGTGWENTQELSIYAIRPDGTDFKLVATRPGHCLGSPKWSPDGRRLVYYDMERDTTYSVRNPSLWGDSVNQIWSVDFATGETKQETNTNTIKISPQYIKGGKGIAYLAKSSGQNVGGLYFDNKRIMIPTSTQSNPSWSPDGKQVVFEAYNMGPFMGPTSVDPGAKIYSWDEDWEYRIGNQFTVLSKTGKIACPGMMRSDIRVSNPDGSNNLTIPVNEKIFNKTLPDMRIDPHGAPDGPLSVIGPAWSPDSQWIAVGVGGFFQDRREHPAAIYRMRANGSDFQQLTDAQSNQGFPSYSHDGKMLVYRVWGPPGRGEYGLRLYDIEKNIITILTNDTLNDNLPSFSPDGKRIAFTRRMNETNFDICTIKPDGTDFKVLTTSGANDGHPAWTYEGRITWSSGASGWMNEAANYDTAEQPYGKIWIMDADGGNKYQLTDSIWEDALPLYLPREVL